MIDQEIVKFLISWINENTIYEKFLLNLEIVVLDLEELHKMEYYLYYVFLHY